MVKWWGSGRCRSQVATRCLLFVLITSESDNSSSSISAEMSFLLLPRHEFTMSGAGLWGGKGGWRKEQEQMETRPYKTFYDPSFLPSFLPSFSPHSWPDDIPDGSSPRRLTPGAPFDDFGVDLVHGGHRLHQQEHQQQHHQHQHQHHQRQRQQSPRCQAQVWPTEFVTKSTSTSPPRLNLQTLFLDLYL